MGHTLPGYVCQFRDSFEPQDAGTSALIRHRAPPGSVDEPSSGTTARRPHPLRESSALSTRAYNKARQRFLGIVPVALREINADIVQMVLADPVAATIAIDYAGLKIGPLQIISVFDAIKARRILAFYDPYDVCKSTGPGSASYQSEIDCLIVGPIVGRLTDQGALGLFQRSVVLHELFHAAVDFQRSHVSRIASEKAAYVFQATYLRMSSFAGSSIPGASRDTGIFHAAFSIADTLLAGRRPTPDQGHALEAAIRAHPAYVNVSRPLHNDGIR